MEDVDVPETKEIVDGKDWLLFTIPLQKLGDRKKSFKRKHRIIKVGQVDASRTLQLIQYRKAKKSCKDEKGKGNPQTLKSYKSGEGTRMHVHISVSRRGKEGKESSSN